MTVQSLIDSNLFQVTAYGDRSKELSKVFCCDLLSIAMGRAPESCVWVTVMGNKNTLAVSSLADVSCIVLAEGVTFTEDELACAVKEGITVFLTDLPVFDAALQVHRLL